MGTTKNWDEELAAAERMRKAARRGKALECDHNSGDPVEELQKFNKYTIQNKHWYPQSAVIHPSCGTIFDATPYDAKEAFLIFYRAKSLIHQIKFLTNANQTLGADKLDELNRLLSMQEDIEANIYPFYVDMIKALKKQDDGKSRNKNRQNRKGHIGINSDVYG